MLTGVKLYKIIILVKIKEKYYLLTERGTYCLIFTFSCNVFQLKLIVFFLFLHYSCSGPCLSSGNVSKKLYPKHNASFKCLSRQDTVFKNRPSKFQGCQANILLGRFLNTSSHITTASMRSL